MTPEQDKRLARLEEALSCAMGSCVFDADAVRWLCALARKQDEQLIMARNACAEFGSHRGECAIWNGNDCDCGFAELQAWCGDWP